MRKLVSVILIILLSDFFFSRCASPVNPTGGPKDTIPPTLLNSNPISGSVNFNQTTLNLEFSEYINAEKLKQNLIVTPKTEIKFKHLVKRNKLEIKFEEPFKENTTYSLNFLEGITDITEKNPAVNLVLAFSTGNFIDTMSVSGKINDLMTGEVSKKFTIGLYPLTDSLDFLSESPLYFTTTNDSGRFNISYIKAGLYRILTFEDENKNLILDPESEPHGFLSDTFELFSPAENLEISTLLQNVKPLQMINNRPIGPYHEIKFNKTIDDYSIAPDSIFHSLTGENKDIIRLYNPNQFNFEDSISIQISATDSLLNTVQDTLKIVFLESNRKQKEFTTSMGYRERSMTNNPLYTINFNKPVLTIDHSKFTYAVDSSFTQAPDSLDFSWNKSKTRLELTTYVSKDSLYTNYRKVQAADSLGVPSSNDTLSTDPTLKVPVTRKQQSPLKFIIEKGAFLSIEQDTSARKKIDHQENFTQVFGTLKLKLVTERTSFIIQLLDSQGKVAYSLPYSLNPIFTVAPATYTVRILIDENNDGKWSFGNLIKNEEPESIYLYPQKIPIRENWIVEDYTISF